MIDFKSTVLGSCQPTVFLVASFLFTGGANGTLGFPGGSDANLPAMQETQVRSLGQEDPLEKGMATHFSIFAWRIPWTEEPGRLQSTGLQSQT